MVHQWHGRSHQPQSRQQYTRLRKFNRNAKMKTALWTKRASAPPLSAFSDADGRLVHEGEIMRAYGPAHRHCMWFHEDLGPPSRDGNVKSKIRRKERRILHKLARNAAKRELLKLV